MPRVAARRRRWFLGVLAFLAAPPVLGGLEQAVEDATFSARFPPPGEVLQVDGHALHLDCRGQGAPTTVLVAGLGGSSANWTVVHDRLALQRRTCAWDRPGTGWSEPRRGAVDVRHDAALLAATLRAAELPPPYVAVAHSYGAWIVRAWHAQQPDDLDGVVLVDPAHPAMLEAACTPACLPGTMPAYFDGFYAGLPLLSRIGLLRGMVWTGAMPLLGAQHDVPDEAWRRLEQVTLRTPSVRAASAEAAAWHATAAEVHALPRLGSLPLTVVSAGAPFEHPAEVTDAEVAAAWATLQADVAGWSTRSLHLTREGADHNALLTARAHADVVQAAALRPGPATGP